MWCLKYLTYLLFLYYFWPVFLAVSFIDSDQIICFLKSSPHDFVVNVSFLKNKLSHLEVFACFKILEIKVWFVFFFLISIFSFVHLIILLHPQYNFKTYRISSWTSLVFLASIFLLKTQPSILLLFIWKEYIFVIHLPSRVQHFVILWTAGWHASLSLIICRS